MSQLEALQQQFYVLFWYCERLRLAALALDAESAFAQQIQIIAGELASMSRSETFQQQCDALFWYCERSRRSALALDAESAFARQVQIIAGELASMSCEWRQLQWLSQR